MQVFVLMWKEGWVFKAVVFTETCFKAVVFTEKGGQNSKAHPEGILQEAGRGGFLFLLSIFSFSLSQQNNKELGEEWDWELPWISLLLVMYLAERGS